jgi:hypothetical protein
MIAVLFSLLVGVAFPLAVLAGLFFWARWLPRRTAAPLKVSRPVFAALAVCSVALLSAPLLGAGYMARLLYLPSAFDIDPSQRSHAFARAISEAMNSASVVCGLTVMLTTPWLLFATWRYHWSVRPTVPKAEPPYR